MERQISLLAHILIPNKIIHNGLILAVPYIKGTSSLVQLVHAQLQRLTNCHGFQLFSVVIRVRQDRPLTQSVFLYAIEASSDASAWFLVMARGFQKKSNIC